MAAEPAIHPVLAMTRRMHDAARAGEWDEVTRLFEARAPALSDIVAPRTRGQLGEVMALDQKVAALVARQRDDLGRALVGLQRGRRAADCYGDAANEGTSGHGG